MGDVKELNVAKVQNDEMDLMDLIKIIYSGRKIVVIVTLVGILLGLSLGYFHDKSISESYTASIEFIYKPEKIDSSEKLKIYSFETYILNSLLRKDGIISDGGGYEIPTVTLGDNAIRFNQKDRYSYRVYMEENIEKEALKKVRLSYDKFLKEVALLGYRKNDFYKLSEKVDVTKYKKRQALFIGFGTFLGLFFGVMTVFFKKFWDRLKKEIKLTTNTKL